MPNFISVPWDDDDDGLYVYNNIEVNSKMTNKMNSQLILWDTVTICFKDPFYLYVLMQHSFWLKKWFDGNIVIWYKQYYLAFPVTRSQPKWTLMSNMLDSSVQDYYHNPHWGNIFF